MDDLVVDCAVRTDPDCVAELPNAHSPLTASRVPYAVPDDAEMDDPPPKYRRVDCL